MYRYVPVHFGGSSGDTAPGIIMLTAKRAAKFVKTRGRYLDGGSEGVRGLYLQVVKPGSGSWVLRHERDGKERPWLSVASVSTACRHRPRAARCGADAGAIPARPATGAGTGRMRPTISLFDAMMDPAPTDLA